METEKRPEISGVQCKQDEKMEESLRNFIKIIFDFILLLTGELSEDCEFRVKQTKSWKLIRNNKKSFLSFKSFREVLSITRLFLSDQSMEVKI